MTVLPLELKQRIEERFAAALAEQGQLHQDALLVHLSNGVDMEIRCRNSQEYSIAWSWGDAELRIDTAPLHPELATFPNHFHDDMGEIKADPVTRPGEPVWDNVSRLIERIVADPLLESAAAA